MTHIDGNSRARKSLHISSERAECSTHTHCLQSVCGFSDLLYYLGTVVAMVLSISVRPCAATVMQKCFQTSLLSQKRRSGSALIFAGCKSPRNLHLTAASVSSPHAKQNKPERRKSVGDVLQGIKAAEKLKGGDDFRKARRTASVPPKPSQPKQVLKQQQRVQHAEAYRAGWQVMFAALVNAIMHFLRPSLAAQKCVCRTPSCRSQQSLSHPRPNKPRQWPCKPLRPRHRQHLRPARCHASRG